jgi:hypothetical protein
MSVRTSVMSDRKPNSLASIFSRLEITAISLALVSAVLYAHGTVFHRAYLESFGLSDAAFPLSADEAMMQGFEAYLLMALRALEKIVSLRPVILIAGFFAVVVLAAGADWIRKRSWFCRVIGQIRGWAYYTPEEYERSIPKPLIDLVIKVSCLCMLFFLLPIVIVATASLLATSGRFKAETFRLACGAGDEGQTIFSISSSPVTVEYEQPGTSAPISARGCVVAAVPELIAIYEKTGTIAVAKARIISIKASPK